MTVKEQRCLLYFKPIAYLRGITSDYMISDHHQPKTIPQINNVISQKKSLSKTFFRLCHIDRKLPEFLLAHNIFQYDLRTAGIPETLQV